MCLSSVMHYAKNKNYFNQSFQQHGKMRIEYYFVAKELLTDIKWLEKDKQGWGAGMWQYILLGEPLFHTAIPKQAPPGLSLDMLRHVFSSRQDKTWGHRDCPPSISLSESETRGLHTCAVNSSWVSYKENSSEKVPEELGVIMNKRITAQEEKV